MVDKRHIDLLVSLAVRGPKGRALRPDTWYTLRWHTLYRLRGLGMDELKRVTREATDEDADRIGQMLVSENLKSIQYRYPDTVDDPQNAPGPIEQYWHQPYHWDAWLGSGPKASAVEGLKAIDCYVHQACEHPGWDHSEARLFCEALRRALIGQLPGYDEAPWEWSESKLALESHHAK
jgi:hypothetical protein